DDLSKIESQKALYQFLLERFPDEKVARIRNFSGQIWGFVGGMKPGDLVVLPSKKKAAIHFGKITGDYTNDPIGPPPYHYRSVDSLATDIARTNIDQDLLYTNDAFMTICRIGRNNAEEPIRKKAANGWKSTPPPLKVCNGEVLGPLEGDTEGEEEAQIDIER